MKKIITNSAHETIKLGEKIASQLKGGEVLCLYGELGAGKTTLIKGIARGLGIKKIITSPTFVLMKVFQVKSQKSKVKSFVHIDCYRIDNASAIEDIGAMEYFRREDAVTVIEWPERIEKLLPKDCIKIKIKHKGEMAREIEIRGTGNG